MIDGDATRRAFSGLIEKPALTDALLNRPPFKFLLDVISNTISSTGYLKNQFPKSDLDPSVLADKAAKQAFLDKLISAVNDGTLSGVKSSKIIAGKEPELTNKLLLKIAENARNHKAEGPAPEKKHREKEKTKEKSSKDKDKLDKDKKERSKSKDRESRSKDKDKEKKSSKDSKEKRSSSKSRDKEKSKEKDEKKEKKSNDKDKPKKEKHKRETEQGSSAEPPDQTNFVDRDLDEGFEESHQLSPHQLSEKLSPGTDSGIVEMDMPLRPPPMANFERPTTAAARPQTSMGRPGTAAARPAPPKIKKKVIATIEEAPVQVESTVEIMADEAPKDDEKNNLFIEQALDEEPSVLPEEDPTQIEAEEGGLVQKMMETKAGLEEGQLLDDLDEDDSEYQREKNKLKDLQKTLQDITRTTFPLAHIFEFVQEDLEAMIRELEKWRAETRQNEAELMEKESMSIGEAQRLSGTLSNIEEEIRNVKVNLNNSKARIVANDERIRLLMNDV